MNDLRRDRGHCAPLHADLERLADAHFEPTFLAASKADARASSEELASLAWSSTVREVAPHVYAVRILTLDWCRRFLEEIDHRLAFVRTHGADVPPPNSMHEHGAILDDLGFGGVLHELATVRLTGLARHLFAEHGGATLDRHHGYLVEYAKDRDRELGFHVDASDVTLNLCLGDAFAGAELTMLGLRCDQHRQTGVRPSEVFEIEHEPGVAILHAGRHRHSVAAIRSGRRRNLILWCSSSAEQAARGPNAQCASWCGWQER